MNTELDVLLLYEEIKNKFKRDKDELIFKSNNIVKKKRKSMSAEEAIAIDFFKETYKDFVMDWCIQYVNRKINKLQKDGIKEVLKKHMNKRIILNLDIIKELYSHLIEL